MKIIDEQQFNESFGFFDKEIVLEIIDIFLGEYEDRLNTIKKAIDELDFPNLKFHAHSIKGVVANFAAPDVHAQAKIMEDKGTNEDNTDLIENFEKLKNLTYDLIDDLKVLRENYV